MECHSARRINQVLQQKLGFFSYYSQHQHPQSQSFDGEYKLSQLPGISKVRRKSMQYAFTTKTFISLFSLLTLNPSYDTI